MKFISISLVCFLATILFCVISANCVIAAVDETTQILEAAVQREKAGNKEEALQIIQLASSTWKSHECFFGTVLRHDEVDNVIEEFARLESYASTEDQDDFLSNCNGLIARLKHIQEMEKPTFQNIM